MKLIVLLVVLLAVFAPFVSPHPEAAGTFVNFDEASQPPSPRHPFGHTADRNHAMNA